MRDYQNEASRIAIRRSSRENETEKQPAMTAPDQSRVKCNAPAFALQPDQLAERALSRSVGESIANRPTISRSLLLQLQRIHGNQYVSRMLQAAEQEDGESSVTPDVEHTIERSRGGGQLLDGGVRHSMGKAMNADFSGVRVHTDSQADGLNRSLHARAFTTGRDVFFRQGEYNPGSSSGRELLAHELTHVIQQGSAVQSKNEEENSETTCSGCAAKNTTGALQTKLTLGAPNDIYEQEADAVASAYINWERQPAAKDGAGSQIRRQESEEEEKEQVMQTKPDASRLSRQPEEEKEEEPLQAKLDDSWLRRRPEDGKLEESVQAKTEADNLQRQSEKQEGVNEDEEMQLKADPNMHQRQELRLLQREMEARGETDGHREIAGAQKASLSGRIQRITCQEEFGLPGTTPEPNALSVQKGAAKTRLRSNLNSWDSYLIDQLRTISNGLFATEQEVAWWGNWAVGLAVDLIGEAIPKPIGTAIKAIAAAGEHIIGQSIASARARLGQAAVDSVIALRTSERNEGETYIDEYYERLRARADEECSGYHDLLLQSIDEWWPELDATALAEARRLAQQLMESVRAAELVERLRREYENCVRLELYRPGGIPSEDEERRAREDCRLRTGYSPSVPC